MAPVCAGFFGIGAFGDVITFSSMSVEMQSFVFINILVHIRLYFGLLLIQKKTK